jgi:transcriptional regulator with XRE-family HTH domain
MNGEAVREPEREQEVVLFIPLPHDLGQAGDGRPRVHRYRSLDLRLGRELQAFRARSGLTQDEVARVVGASSAAISEWEASRKVPDGLRRERVRELLDGRLWPELRAALLGGESFPRPWREAVRWYRRAARDVPARVTWGVPIRQMLDSLQTAEDLAGLRLAYVQAGPVGSAGAALTGTAAGSAERRIEDAAFGLRWLEIAQAGRFDLNKSLARQLPLERLNDSGAAPTDSRPGHGAD